MEEKGSSEAGWTKNYNRWRKKVGPKITTDGGKDSSEAGWVKTYYAYAQLFQLVFRSNLFFHRL